MIHDENQGKKPLPENDLLTPLADEHLSQEQKDASEEQDLDDLVHSAKAEEIPENEEIDGDDAVHNTANPSFDPGTEKDPDDLVHGN